MIGHVAAADSHALLADSSRPPLPDRRHCLTILLAGVAGCCIGLSAAPLARVVQWSGPPGWAGFTASDQSRPYTSPPLQSAAVSPLQPNATQRCSHVIERVVDHNFGKSRETLREQFELQSKDPNLFYRGTAYLFWEDFTLNGWGFNLTSVVPSARLRSGEAPTRTSTWTWISGDQHLSNFGAWKNRHGQVVFGINDFDEAAVYDFHIDVWRLAVSIFDHVIFSNFSRDQAAATVAAFADEYVLTVSSYVGNERAFLNELTSANVDGDAHSLGDFLRKVEGMPEAKESQLHEFTYVGTDGMRRFILNESTSLAPVSSNLRHEIVQAMRKENYGATMYKIGWRAFDWKDSFFEVRDVARRVGSGDGSYGAPRYYVLLAGSDRLEHDDDNIDGVILDVKYAGKPAIRDVLSLDDQPWYDVNFPIEGARVIMAQHRLTSYEDPLLGYVFINDDVYIVRERSPWKKSFDFEVEADELEATVRQLAWITATHHVRGGVGKPPLQFKEVIMSALFPAYAREQWAAAVTATAEAYREQLLLDYDCFREWLQWGAPLESQPDRR